VQVNSKKNLYIHFYLNSIKESFENVKYWFNEIERHGNENVNKMLVGNKCDLISKIEVNHNRATVRTFAFLIKLGIN
jgi:GTPase SAR1 family protein